MIIERAIAPFVVYGEDSVLRALEKITANKARIVFCVTEHGHLIGSLTDGDVRRWLAGRADIDLGRPCSEAANTEAVRASAAAAPAEIRPLFAGAVDHVPLLDERGHLVAVAVNRSDAFRVGRHEVGKERPTFVISEIGINHNGSVELAKHLVDLSAEAGADAVKFQLRDMAALYRGGTGSAGEDLGPQYTLDLLSRFNLPAERLFEVFDHARDRGIDVMCTPWDAPSVDALVEYGVPALKIASADLTNHTLLTHAAASGTPLVVSTGMSTEAEIRESVALLRSTGTPYALLHCQSTYPAPFKDVNLSYLTRLAELGDCPVGYSGHERGYHVPIAAVALGATIVEKHFTVDKTMEGNDHKVSLLPHEMREMVARIRELEEALGSTEPRQVSTGEMMNRVNLAKSLVAARDIEAGEVIAREAVDVKSPGRGLQPNALDRLVGRTANRSMAAGEFFYASDLADAVPKGRAYAFRRPWGLPVRYHDVEPLTADCTPDFLEFHFSYKDLEIDPHEALREPLPMGYACHAPDLFAGDFILNLASEDDAHWERSVEELQRVIDITRSMRDLFTQEDDPVVISSVGGFTTDRHVPLDEIPDMYARVAAGLDRVDDSGVRLACQTLPPFPWYMGGQLYCNLFVRPDDTAEFAQRYGRRLCLDVSHSKLAATFLGVPFSRAVDLLAPHTEHLHLVDAVGVDGEGVQVGDGEVDWAVLAEQLDAHAPGVSFIPEIWQGHVNHGEGFWVALERLEQWF
ncbi:N-acetylneuraminate synthase family protein [Phycicoccus sp. CSK15P-2]|uniref:N-acetylneuraminate synthase family protein n=1 Tax=Phycicoccus sp. CSK15P-2 TaxID=2807627 RepID=UPI00194FD8B2|nr:N-acetylneuraminate synthase family protein [Phycicoccus sp. CSK15P-2]MBM6404315.1 N-acetylneuraminate synthase family protein [Phycicoccus sp. CSK15P-2]